MSNTQAITNNLEGYVVSYIDKFGVAPKSWFTYLRWLANCNKGHTFQPNEVELAINLFEMI